MARKLKNVAKFAFWNIKCKRMKNKLAIYLSLLAMIFVASSCSNNDADEANSPYAYIKTFSIGDIKSSYPSFTETGKDTTIVKTISGSSYLFTINQASGEIYNNDSLPFATNRSKIVVNMTVEGVVTMYVDETDAYEYIAVDDSIDFTYPRKFRVISPDGSYSKDYTISVNAHTAEPDLMVWNRVSNAVGVSPEKVLEFDGKMLVFGRLADNSTVFVSSPLGKDVYWSVFRYLTLPSSVDFSTMQSFNGMLYVLADGDLYESSDAETWQKVLSGSGLISIIGASEADGYLWLANADNIYRTADGKNLELMSALPKDFPLYGVSTVSYALSHNQSIVRYMLVGYAEQDKSDAPKVWSMLSNDCNWVEYANAGNKYPCPALDGLRVVRYDNQLYALGGKGVVNNSAVEAFNSFYVSRDNGIVWKAPDDFYQRLPEALLGENIPFGVCVDSDNYMWIITTDDKAGVLRGRINRLGFKK